MVGLSGVQYISSDGIALKRFATREPNSLFSLRKNAKSKEEKERLNQLLELLKKKLPDGFKIGAAVGEADCFFDSIAQGLKELQNKGLIKGCNVFSVKSLRESCKRYAQQVSQSKKDSWLNNTLKEEGKGCDISNGIAINYKERTSYIKVLNVDRDIGYSHLFPSKTQERKNKFSINKHFTLFVEELEKDKNIRYFIIYTNKGLDLTEEKRLKKGHSKDFYPFKLDSIDIQKKKYKILRNCLCINKTGLYRFSQEEITKLSSLLKLPPSFQREKEVFADDSEKEIKENFLHKLIFAVNQPIREELNTIMTNEIENKSNEVLYNYEELHEIALRSLESHDFGPITKEKMEKLLADVKSNRSSYEKIRNKNISEEIKFAKSVVGSNAAKAFKELYDLWFDVNGNKTQYLKTLEEEGVNLATMSSVLNGAGTNAAEAFKELYGLLFDAKGNKTQYLKTLEEEEVNLASMSSILSGAGVKASKAFEELYDLWFDVEGNKTQYLKTLETEGVSLANMSSILSRAAANAAKAFKSLYNLWFDARGNKTQYLRTFEVEGINLTNITSILHGAAASAAKAFKGLYNLWFDGEGNKTQYLKTLEEKGIDLTNLSSILNGAGANAPKAFKELYNIFFDERGNKRQYLKHFLKKKYKGESFTLHNLSSILSGAGANVKDSFEKLHNVCFDDKGKRRELLDDFYNAGFRPDKHFGAMNLRPTSEYRSRNARLGEAPCVSPATNIFVQEMCRSARSFPTESCISSAA
ncbi:hypothetical protein AVEN_114390-1 [Araneus ventricosus]|uniref:Uncharacterized protein n=1 Tax=Araneus ventricosus TaxID=182803 RepID=A0A4Y2KQ46_ARAVE|nr:hypothetical protein AVEN_114390-1 [Araneus ventricosus]